MYHPLKIFFVMLMFSSFGQADSQWGKGKKAYWLSCTKTVPLPVGRVNAVCRCALRQLEKRKLGLTDSSFAQLAQPRKKLTPEEAGKLALNIEHIEKEQLYELEYVAREGCLDIEKDRTAMPLEDEE